MCATYSTIRYLDKLGIRLSFPLDENEQTLVNTLAQKEVRVRFLEVPKTHCPVPSCGWPFDSIRIHEEHDRFHEEQFLTFP
jgi:hypothetical protein